nr:hypothetical protein [Tanacetum cinerariifolium]
GPAAPVALPRNRRPGTGNRFEPQPASVARQGQRDPLRGRRRRRAARGHRRRAPADRGPGQLPPGRPYRRRPARAGAGN